MAVTGPPAKAEFAPGRSTLVAVSGQRTFGPLSIVRSTIALRQQWFVSVRSGKQGGATKEDPQSINTAHRTPAALPSRAPRNDAAGMLAVSVQPPRFVERAPRSRGRNPQLPGSRYASHEESKSHCRRAAGPRRRPRRRRPPPAAIRPRARAQMRGRAASPGADAPDIVPLEPIEKLGKDMLYDTTMSNPVGLCLRPVPRPHYGLHVGARIDRQSGRGAAARGRTRPVGQPQALDLPLRRLQPGGPLLRHPECGLYRREFLGWPCL